MINLTIGTWNLEDNYSLIGKNEKKADAIIDLLMDNQIRILGLQGVNPRLAQKLDERLGRTYSYYSITSAYEKVMNPIKSINRRYNLIISDLPYYRSKQYRLPTYIEPAFGDYFDCSLTQQNFLIGDDILQFYNTCLYDNDEEMNHHQINTLYAYLIRDMIACENMNSILLGSFNENPNSDNMRYFTEILDGVKLGVIESPTPTCQNEKLDYIVVPNNYILDSVECIDGYDKKISSHKPVIAKLLK